LIAVRAPFSGRSPASRLREPRGERESKLSRTEKQEQAAAKEASSKKFADADGCGEAVQGAEIRRKRAAG